MNIKSELENKLYCKICCKFYKSMSSLCNYNKKFHSNNNNFIIKNNNSEIKNNNSNIKNNTIGDNIEIKNKIYSCKICDKIYQSQQSKWRHEQTCKIIQINKDNKELEINNNYLPIFFYKFFSSEYQ